MPVYEYHQFFFCATSSKRERERRAKLHLNSIGCCRRIAVGVDVDHLSIHHAQKSCKGNEIGSHGWVRLLVVQLGSFKN